MLQFKFSFYNLLILIALSACVTINVYFPAAAAEKAADRLIQEVWEKKQAEQPAQQPAEKPKENSEPKNEQPQSHLSRSQILLGNALDLLVVPAQAATADFNVTTTSIEALKKRMKQRFSTLDPYYNSGALGLTNDGLIVLRNASAVPLSNRNKVTQESNSENQDRLALYQAIADANGHPEWMPQIRSTFAQRWISNARKGWWYQDNGGQWVEK